MIGVGGLVESCSPQYARMYLSALDRLVAALDLELDNRPQGPDFEGFAEVVDQISAYQQELEASSTWAEELLHARLLFYGGAAAVDGTLTDIDAARLIELVVGKARGDALEDAQDRAREILPILPANELASAGHAIGTLERMLSGERENPDRSGLAEGKKVARQWAADRSALRTGEAEPTGQHPEVMSAETVFVAAEASAGIPASGMPTTVRLQPPPAPVPLPTAGWYVDPENDRMLRRWNGTDWTSETTLRSAIARRVSFGQAVGLAFRGIFTYRGRSTAGEFWWFFLFNGLVVGALYVLILLATPSDPYERMMASGGAADLFSLVLTVWIFVYLVLVIPLIVRRLHDKDMSGWLAILIPVPLGSLVLLILLIGAGTPGPNRYGPVPTAIMR